MARAVFSVALIGGFVLDCAIAPKPRAQDAAPEAQEAPAAPETAAKPKKPPHKRKAHGPAQPAKAPSIAPAQAASQKAAESPAPQTASSNPPPQPASLKFAVQLAHAGTKTCLGRIEELGAATLESTTAFGIASNWIVGAPDTRPVSVLVGQHYGSAAVPYGATTIVAAPVGSDQCDGFAIQVVPSPLTCAALKQNILTRGKALADLAGVALLQDAGGQTLLVPTGANTCVLVGLKHAHTR